VIIERIVYFSYNENAYFLLYINMQEAEKEIRVLVNITCFCLVIETVFLYQRYRDPHHLNVKQMNRHWTVSSFFFFVFLCREYQYWNFISYYVNQITENQNLE
jgi:hypothetical protein